MNRVGEQHTEDNGREKRDQQIKGETLRVALGGQAFDDFEDLRTKLPDHRKNGPQLNNDVERHGAFAAKLEQVGDNNLVAGTRDGQELGQAFNRA